MLPSPESEYVFLIPGQGADPRGALCEVYSSCHRVRIETDTVLDDIQRTWQEIFPSLPVPPFREILLTSSREKMGPGVPQLAGYAISVILARSLVAAGVTPTAIVGQSFGEIAALVCAGVFDVTDGTRAVCALNAAFRAVEGQGAMVLLPGTGEDECRRLLAVSGIPDIELACVNAPDQTIISGPIAAVEKFLSLPGPQALRLSVPYASHHPSLSAVADEFLERLRSLPQRPMQTPVYSPVRRRAYTDDDDLHLALADCVVKPVYFPETLEWLGGERIFVELGAGDGISRCVVRTLPGSLAVAPLADDSHWFSNLFPEDN